MSTRIDELTPKYFTAKVPPDHLLLDRSPNIGPLIFRWELDKFKKMLKQKL